MNKIIQVDCAGIFASEEIDKPSGHPAMQWEMIPDHIQVGYKQEQSLNDISSDPTYEDGNTRFTTVPLKPLSDQ